ncbi:MAG: hypothetical protein ACFE8A_12470 [Candidatus Hodarchaeota archaeon]
MDLLPKILRTEDNMVDFDPSKIQVSLMIETFKKYSMDLLHI